VTDHGIAAQHVKLLERAGVRLIIAEEP
jgi:hypothetical protein